MDMELKEIEALVREVCAEQGFTLDIPVKMNGRLSRTLGRVKYSVNSLGVHATVMEFNTKYFSNPNVKPVNKRQTILHETAHYLAYKADGQAHAHDEEFRYWCLIIGCVATGEYITDENGEIVENVKIEYKYDCRCSACNTHLRYYKRRPSRIDNKVSGCCHKPIELIQLY